MDAIAAVEGEATLELNPSTSMNITTGGIIQVKDEDDSDVVLLKLDTSARTFQMGQTVDQLQFQFIANNVFIDASSSIIFRDVDDSFASLLVFNTTARTLVIGAAADKINATLNGDWKFVDNVGFYNTAPVAQSAAYTRNATIVEDRTLLASASATAINNNNVLAALIADLQATGLLG